MKNFKMTKTNIILNQVLILLVSKFLTVNLILIKRLMKDFIITPNRENKC